MSLPGNLAWVGVLCSPLNRGGRSEPTSTYSNVELTVDLGRQLLRIGSRSLRLDVRTIRQIKTSLDAEFAT